MFNIKVCFVIFILIFMNIWQRGLCFDVSFREYHGAVVEPFNTQIQKRDMAQFFDKASYSFNGFEKIESVPVQFPNDICILNLMGIKYAAALHNNKNGERHFAVFKFIHDNYELLADVATPNATGMDCKAIGAKGYVAIAFNITTPIVNAREGSPIYEIADDRLRAVQYFASPHLHSVYLRVTGNDLFLLQTFRNSEETPNTHCPYYKWSGRTFNRLGRIPCTNARHLEPFSIDYESYVAVANYADQRGRTSTYSEIYKFVREKKRFQLVQKIKTNGAVDVRYFNVPYDAVRRQHFLIFGNSLNRKSKSSADGVRNLEADSVFYVFDKGQFVPYQSLSLYAVERFLPVQNTDAEKFLLLVACANQDIKIYNLNDWKFEESEVQFTEGALSRGVANMRIYQENDNSYLVIANELMTDNATNIFLPIFKQDEHANALRQQIIDWAKTTLHRMAQIDVEKLKHNVEVKLAKHAKTKVTIEAKDISSANIQTVVTNSFVHPPMQFTSNYWKALSYANQALDALQAEIELVNPQRTKRESNERVMLESTAYELDQLHVGTLVVRDRLSAQKVNGVSVQQPQFDSITARRVVVTGSYQAPRNNTNISRMPDDSEATSDNDSMPDYDEDMEDSGDVLQVENLLITGKLNEYTWHELVNNTLKRAGLQFVKAPARITNLAAKKVVVTSNAVSGHNLNKLISINGGNYVIDQDIQFAAPVIANNVVIHERLNNIHVYQGQFDVLLKQSNATQVIEGAKRFDNVRVLEPITISGQVLGEQLQSIAPHKTVHDDIVLSGDYTINGDIIVSALSAADIILPAGNVSVSDTLRNGVNMLETLDDINIRFEQPIAANDSLITFINQQDLQQLVRTNVDGIQVIEGKKIFKNTLEIRKGFSEVKYLNGVDVEALEKRLLLKKADQTIKVPMQFGTIIAKSIHAPILNLNNRTLDQYLTKSGNQHITATLKVNRLHAKSAKFESLQTNGRIFDSHPSDLQQQKARSATQNADIFQKNRQFQGTIYVHNLLTNATINGKDVREIEGHLRQLNGDIRFVGDYKFNYDMNITHLTFQGKLNGIPAVEFGHCWLQKTGAQTFSAPQTLSAANCDAGLRLNGTLNGYRFEDFFTNAIWVNRDEFAGTVMFQNPIQMQGALTTRTLNGLHVPLDMLYQSAAQPQVLHASILLHQDLQVTGGIFNTTNVNGINLAALEHFLTGHDYDTLHVEHAHFVQAPQYNTLNQHNLQQTLDAVWLANENVDLHQHVEISDATFQGLLQFEGPINNLNMNYLKENYFSLTRPQQVSTELVFAGTVNFQHDFHADNLHVMQPVVDSTSNTAFNFDEFVSNTLKTDGPHEIRAVWSIVEAIIQGDLRKVRINNLNLADDVVLLNAPYREIIAPKRVNMAVIKKLYTSPSSTVNGVGVSDWIRDTVFVYENHTIQGVTTLDVVNMYNDLHVRGKVNNLTFDEQTLLLRDLAQTVHGDVRVRNIFPDSQRILVNNIESLHAEQVNGQQVAHFFTNRADLAPVVQVHGNLVFMQPLVVHEYHNLMDGTDERAMKTRRRTSQIVNYNASLTALQMSVRALQQTLAAPHYILDHFELRQTLKFQATRIVYLPLYLETGLLDVVGIFNESNNDVIKYYQWSPELQQFVPNKDLLWLPQDKSLVDILELVFEHTNNLTIEKAGKEYYQNVLHRGTEGLEEILQLRKKNGALLAAITIPNAHCIAVYGSHFDTVPVYCMQQMTTGLRISQKTAIPRQNVKQILALSRETAAVMFDDAVEIWHTSETPNLVQRIQQTHAMRMAVGAYKNLTYLAIIAKIKSNSLQHSTIEIYRSENTNYYEHLQSIDCTDPLQVAFNALQQSHDLLLHVLTTSSDQPLIVYQYKGVAGFEKIVGASVLPVTASMQQLELKASQRHLTALFGREDITFVEAVLRRF